MSKVLGRGLLWLVASSAFAWDNPAWNAVRPGLEVLTASFMDRNSSKVSFTLVRCDPKVCRVRVVDTLRVIGRGGKGNAFAAYSIREVGKVTRALVVINAGSTGSYSLPAPVGLLMTHGAVVSRVNPSSTNGGILCVAGDHLVIAPVSGMSLQKCSDAVQRGPLLSNLAGVAGASDRYRRTVVALDQEGKLLMLVTNEKTTLSDLAAFLYTSKPDLKIQSALNLDGDTSSGMLLAAGSGQAMPVTIGNVDGLVASAIAITGRNLR